MRIALLGAYGQLGSDLRSALSAHDVIPFGHDDFDIADGASTRRRLSEASPDLIVNTAAFHKVELCEEHPERAFAVNATAPGGLAKLASELGAGFVHMSTDYVYGGGSNVRPLAEDVAPSPVQVYGASKAAGEWLVALAHRRALIVRSSGLYGLAGASGKGGNFIQLVLRLAREKGEMRIVNDQILSPTYTADLAQAISTLIAHRACGIVHVTSSGSCSWHELASYVVQSVGLEAAVHAISTAEFGAPVRRPVYSVLDNARWRVLRLSPLRTWQDAVRAYLEAKGEIKAVASGAQG